MRKIVVVAATIIMIGSVILAVFESFRVRKERHSLEAIGASRRALEQRLVQIGRENRGYEIKHLQSESKRPRPRAQFGDGMETPELSATIKLIHSSPELEAKYARAARARIALLYGRFLRAQTSTPELQSEVIAALASRSQDKLAIEAEADLRKQPFDAPDIQAKMQSVDDLTAAKLQRLLGQNGYERFHDYEDNMNIRAVVDQLAGNLYYAEHPLTKDQADELTIAIANAIPIGAPFDPLLADDVPGGIDWGAAVLGAAKVLTPDQLATFQLLAELNKDGRMN